MKLNFISFSPGDTRKLAKLLVSWIRKRDQSMILALSGDLGSGKTTFVQGLAKALGIKERVISPTFVVMKPFALSGKSWRLKLKKNFFWHIDCWRLDQKDFWHLGLEEILKDRENIVCLEWAEKVKRVLPKNTVWLSFKHAGGNKRFILMGNSYISKNL